MLESRVVEIVGRFIAASNATLLGATADGTKVVYKPAAGERPLWDFPPESLATREVLTYELDRELGFGVVPETVLGDGPYGPGSVQRFIETDDHFDPVPEVRAGDRRLWPVAVLDVLANNADRKLGHLLREAGSGRIIAIDHGLTFHEDDKLRTVLWAFAGREIPATLLDAVDSVRASLAGAFGARVADLLGRRTLAALRVRCNAVVATRTHPDPPGDRPALPWPVF